MDKQEKTETKTDLAVKKQKAADQNLPKEKEKRGLDKAFIVNLTEADLKYLDEMNYGTPEETFP